MKIDSIAENSRIVQGALIEIKPPEHIRMTPEDMPFFRNVIAEFAKAEWSQHQLEIAAILARTLCDLEREQYELRQEGSVSKTEKGTPVPNPRKTIVQMHASSILSLRKSIGVDARSKGDIRDTKKRSEKAKEIEYNATGGDGLIARPTLN